MQAYCHRQYSLYNFSRCICNRVLPRCRYSGQSTNYSLGLVLLSCRSTTAAKPKKPTAGGTHVTRPFKHWSGAWSGSLGRARHKFKRQSPSIPSWSSSSRRLSGMFTDEHDSKGQSQEARSSLDQMSDIDEGEEIKKWFYKLHALEQRPLASYLNLRIIQGDAAGPSIWRKLTPWSQKNCIQRGTGICSIAHSEPSKTYGNSSVLQAANTGIKPEGLFSMLLYLLQGWAANLGSLAEWGQLTHRNTPLNYFLEQILELCSQP